MRLLRVLAVVIAAISTAAAQPSQAALESARATALLESPSWIDKAWGAWLAGRLADDSLNALLMGQLQRAEVLRDAQWNSEERGYVQALLDALLVSGAKPPAGAILPFADCCHTEVLILMARADGDNEDTLLDLRSRQLNDGEWLLVNNLLFHVKSPRFFSETLEEMRITHRFAVVDGAGGFGGGSGRGGSFGDGIHPMPKGFPPIAFYQLITSAEEGSVIAFRGPHNAYYRRTVVPTGKQVPWNRSGDQDRQLYRIEYLANLVGESTAQVQPILEQTSSIEWRGAPSMAAEIKSALDGQAAAILEFVDRLRAAGMAGVSGMRLQIVPEVMDGRPSAQDPLPTIAPREIVLP